MHRDGQESWGPLERLPAIANSTPAKHKRCVSFQESQVREKIMRRSGGGSALHIETVSLSRYNDTLEEISKLIGRSDGPKKRVSIDESGISGLDLNKHLEKSKHFLGATIGYRQELQAAATTYQGGIKPIQHGSLRSNLSLFSAQNPSRDTVKKRERKSSTVTDEVGKLEKELLVEYLDLLHRAHIGEDILKQQATALLNIESELRFSELKKVNNDRERTILESLDGSSYQSRTMDNRSRLDHSSHQSLIEYKFKLQEVNKQMTMIEQYRRQIDSLECDLAKLDQRRDLIVQKSQAASEIHRLEDVGIFKTEKRSYSVYFVF